MSYIFQIIETEKQPVLSVQATTSMVSLPNVVSKVYGSVLDCIRESGEEPLGPAFIAYYNTDMENLTVEIGFPVAKEMAGKGDVALRFIPAGKKATAFHKGAYQEMSPLYEKLAAWINQRGYEPTGVVYEYYYNSPQACVRQVKMLAKGLQKG